MSELSRDDFRERETEHARRAAGEASVPPDQPSRRESSGEGDGNPKSRTSAENLCREEYGDQLRAKGPPIPTADQPSESTPPTSKTEAEADERRKSTDRQSDPEPSDQTDREPARTLTNSPDTATSAFADPRDATVSNAHDEANSPSGEPARPAHSFSHYQGEFKGQILDLYTDGTRWASSQRAEVDNVVGQAPDRPPADTDDLPPVGEQLLHMESEKASRAERMRLEGYRSADEILEVTSKWSELGHDLLAKQPPTGHTEASTHPEASPGPHEGINPGDTASALLVLTALTAEAIGKV